MIQEKGANVFHDNDYAIKLALNPIFHEKTKYFEVDLHFVTENVTNGLLKYLKLIKLVKMQIF